MEYRPWLPLVWILARPFVPICSEISGTHGAHRHYLHAMRPNFLCLFEHVGSNYANLNTATFDHTGVLWFTGQGGIYGRLDPVVGRV